MSVEADAAPSATTAARWLASSERLRRRRLELLPLRGPGAVFTEPQGRSPSSPALAPDGLTELISSIAEVGVLQPVLVEEMADPGAPAGVRRRLVVGERRLRAVRWGATNLPDNPHFGALPALVCPGPVSDEEVRVWQVIENLVRSDPLPGELAAALLYERCALLTTRLAETSVAVPRDVGDVDDPVVRWEALERLRRTKAPQVGAPWPEVLARLGLQLREETAARLVRAFKTLPPGVSADMDAAAVGLATRLRYLRLDRGRRDAATAIWDAVKARGQPQLLAGAVRAATDDPSLAPAEAVAQAASVHAAANDARRAALSRPSDGAAQVHDTIAEDAIVALRSLLGALRAGHALDCYATGSLRLLSTELLERLDGVSTLASRPR